jgi:hypothetical protein
MLCPKYSLTLNTLSQRIFRSFRPLSRVSSASRPSLINQNAEFSENQNKGFVVQWVEYQPHVALVTLSLVGSVGFVERLLCLLVGSVLRCAKLEIEVRCLLKPK